jgi:hypothetical protein
VERIDKISERVSLFRVRRVKGILLLCLGIIYVRCCTVFRTMKEFTNVFMKNILDYFLVCNKAFTALITLDKVFHYILVKLYKGSM